MAWNSMHSKLSLPAIDQGQGNFEQAFRIEKPQIVKSEDTFKTFAAGSHSTQPFACSGSLQTKQKSVFQCCNSFGPDSKEHKRHGRAILTDEQARSIYQHKPAPFAKAKVRAGALARKYGVSVKTVRDIWIGRTWYRATFDLDTSKPISPERLEKRCGRPKGAKDSKPRTRKPAHEDCPSPSGDCPEQPSRADNLSTPLRFPRSESGVDNHHEKRPVLFMHRLPSQPPFGYQQGWTLCDLTAPPPPPPVAPPRPCAASVPGEDIWWDWAPALASDAPAALVDPFHDDWAFWPTDCDHTDGPAQLEAARRPADDTIAAPSPATPIGCAPPSPGWDAVGDSPDDGCGGGSHGHGDVGGDDWLGGCFSGGGDSGTCEVAFGGWLDSDDPFEFAAAAEPCTAPQRNATAVWSSD